VTTIFRGFQSGTPGAAVTTTTEPWATSKGGTVVYETTVGGMQGAAPSSAGAGNLSVSTEPGSRPEWRLGFLVSYHSSTATTATYLLATLRVGTTVVADIGLRNASGSRFVAYRDNFVVDTPDSGTSRNMAANETFRVEWYFLNGATTVSVWFDWTSTGAPDVVWTDAALAVDADGPYNLILGPDANTGVDAEITDAWLTTGESLYAASAAVTPASIVSGPSVGTPAVISAKVPTNMMLIAHRGIEASVQPASAEESVAGLAVLMANNPDVNGIEIDNRMSSDKVCFLAHDSTGDRVHGFPETYESKTAAQLDALGVTRLSTYLAACVQYGFEQILVQHSNSLADMDYLVNEVLASPVADRVTLMTSVSGQYGGTQMRADGWAYPRRIGVYGVTSALYTTNAATFASDQVALIFSPPSDGAYLTNRAVHATIKGAGYELGLSTMDQMVNFVRAHEDNGDTMLTNEPALFRSAYLPHSVVTPASIVSGPTMGTPAIVSGAVRVSKTHATSWDVYSRVAKTHATSWSVRTRVAKTAATSWSVFTRVAKTFATSWDVEGGGGVTRVAKTHATSWDVYSRVSKTHSTSWSVLSRVAKTAATSWAVLTRVAKTQATTWDVEGVPGPPLTSADTPLDMRLRAYAPNGLGLGILPAPDTYTAALPLNDSPSLTVTYGVGVPRSELLGAPLELALEVSGDGGLTWTEPDDCRFIYLRDGRDPSRVADSWAAEAPGYIWRLSKAKVLSEGKANAEGRREFTSVTPGAILKTFLTEATTRGALAGMDFSSFSAGTDSAGAAWGTTLSRSYDLGTDYQAVLQDLADTGWLDFRMSGRSLKVYRPDTTLATDRTVGTPQVTLSPLPVTEDPFRRTWEGLAGYIHVQGDEATSVGVINGGALQPWGRWEDFITAGGVTDAGTLTAYGQAYQDTTSDVRVEYTRGLVLAGGPKPLLDYMHGDFLWSRGMDGTRVKRRVRQITLEKAAGVPTGNVVLNDRFLEADVRTKRRLDAITGGASAGGSTGGPVLPGADILQPSQVTGLSGGSSAYLDGPTIRAQMSLDWADTTTNVDGTALTDLDHYEVEGRPTGTGANWREVTRVPQSSATLSPYAPAESWDFHVRAVDTAGNWGAWSTVVTVVAASDTTPPPVPSTPTTSSDSSGVLQVSWNGLTSTAGPMPGDFTRVEVHVSPSNNFTPNPGDSSTLVGTLTGAGKVALTGYARGSTYRVKLIARDTSLNASDPSAQASQIIGTGSDLAVPVVPGGWTVTLAPLGVGALTASWPAVPNADAVTYDVYARAGSAVSVFDATTFIGSTGATSLPIWNLPGAILTSGVDYYVAVKVRDQDGTATTTGTAGPVSIRQATQELVAADYVYGGLIETKQLKSGQVDADLVIGRSIATAVPGGRRVALSSGDGFSAEDSDGDAVMSIPTDMNLNVAVNADLVAQTITALGTVALRAPDNEVAQNANVILRSGTSAPVTPVVPKITWNTYLNGTDEVFGPFFHGGYISGDDMVVAFGAYGAGSIRRFSRTGAFTGTLATLDPRAGNYVPWGVAKIGTNFYTMGVYGDETPKAGLPYSPRVWVTKWSATWAFVSEWEYGPTSDFTDHMPAMGSDGTNLLFARSVVGTNVVTFGYRNPDTGATVGSNVNTDISYDGHIGSVQVGAFDFGSTRVVMTTMDRTSGDRIFVVNPTTGVRDTNLEWPGADGDSMAFLAWDATDNVFRHLSRSISQKVYKYDGNFWSGPETQTWKATNTWEDTDTSGGSLPHETAQGPVATFSMKKRANLQLTSPPIPTDTNLANKDDAVAANFYVGNGDGTRLTQYLQASPADGVRTVTITKSVFSNADTFHPNPPAFGNFPNGTPAKVISDDMNYWFDGFGNAILKTLTLGSGVLSRLKIVPAMVSIVANTNGTVTVAHGLGSLPLIVLPVSTTSAVWNVTVPSWDATNVTVGARRVDGGGNVTVDISVLLLALA
jgi:hypothetical protein